MKENPVCETEEEFREWFDRNYRRIGIKRIILSQKACPDYVVEMDDGVNPILS